MSSKLVLTLKSKTEKTGFVDGTLKINVYYDDIFENVINNINNYRSPKSKIENVYNTELQNIPKTKWNFKIKNNYTFYV